MARRGELKRIFRQACQNGSSVGDLLNVAQTIARRPNSWNRLRVLRTYEDIMGHRHPEDDRREYTRRTDRATRRRNVRNIEQTDNRTIFDVIDSEMTFGIEIELISPINSHSLAAKIVEVGIDCQSEHYNHITREHWKIVTDASLQSINGYTLEIVSPVLKGKDGLESLKKVCDALESIGCKINKTCGLHVHHGLRHLNEELAPKVISNTIIMYKKWQSQFNAMLPKSRRIRNRYCKSFTRNEINNLYFYNANLCIRTRYKHVNPHSYWKHGTVEFRQHSGTVNFEKISNWVVLTQLVVKKAINVSENGIMSYEAVNQLKKMVKEVQAPQVLKTYINNRVKHFRNVQRRAA